MESFRLEIYVFIYLGRTTIIGILHIVAKIHLRGNIMLSNKTIYRDDLPPLPRRVLQKIRKQVAPFGRKKINKSIKNILINVEFTIICNNCLGGTFYHDAGRQFTSPTINLALDGEDFIMFLENLTYYLNKDFQFIHTNEVDYPVAKLDDIEVRFVHYRTEKECIDSWNRRKQRILWDKLFIVATDHDGMKNEMLLERFDNLPYQNKIMFTSEEYPKYEWAICVPQFRGRPQVRIMTEFADFKGTRYYETCFDLAKWIIDNSK